MNGKEKKQNSILE